MIRSVQQNTADGIDERLQELQKVLLKKSNNKEAYDEIADEIFKLREQREKCTVDTAARDAQIARINELQDFIKQQPTHLEALVQLLSSAFNLFFICIHPQIGFMAYFLKGKLFALYGIAAHCQT